MYGRDCLLPVDFTVVSWSLVDWGEVQSTEDLLAARMRQLDERELSESRAAGELERARRINKNYFDRSRRIRPENQHLNVGDLILLFNSTRENSRDRRLKLDNNWFGPHRIREVGDGFYRLEELDGTHFKESFAGNRLIKFFPRDLANIGRNGIGDYSGSIDEPGEREEASRFEEISEDGV